MIPKDPVDSFDFYAHSSRTLQILEAKFGPEGFCFFVKLLQLLRTEDGHGYDARHSLDFEYLIKALGNYHSVETMLNLMAEWGKIDAVLWSEKIIWYQGFTDSLEKRYSEKDKALPTRSDFLKRLGLSPSLPKEKPPSEDQMSLDLEELEIEVIKPPKKVFNFSTNKSRLKFLEEIDKTIQHLKSQPKKSLKEAASKSFLANREVCDWIVITYSSLRDKKRSPDDLDISKLGAAIAADNRYIRATQMGLLGISKWNIRVTIESVEFILEKKLKEARLACDLEENEKIKPE